jgi:hypothetical protein
VKVPKGKTITFVGTGDPVLEYDETAGEAGSTAKSASVSILADYFIAYGVVFQVWNLSPAVSVACLYVCMYLLQSFLNPVYLHTFLA